MNRCVDIVVGLQAGSEGKGKLVSILAPKYGALVRTGGPNAAHTVYLGKEKVSFHQIPCGALHAPKAKLVLGAGAQIDIEHLKHEIEILKKHNMWLDSDGQPRLLIDSQATIIDPIDKIAENGGRMPDCGDIYFHPRDCNIHNEELIAGQDVKVGSEIRTCSDKGKVAGTCLGCPMLPKDSAWAKIGSTTHGAGVNMIRKMTRGTKMAIPAGAELDVRKLIVDEDKVGKPTYEQIVNDIVPALRRWSEAAEPQPVRLAPEDEFLKQFVGDTVSFLNKLVDKGVGVMLEGTQGAVLSLHHGYYPKTTSRDTNASNWCAEAGISPLAVRDVYGVARTFPIRVAGDSGPMSGEEITWEEISEHASGKDVKKWRDDLIKLQSKLKNGRTERDPQRLSNLVDGTPEHELSEQIRILEDSIKEFLIEEVTTATKRRRRVFTFGEPDFKKAMMINRCTKLMLTFVDYLSKDDKDHDGGQWSSLSQKTRDWIATLESKMGVHFDYLSMGPLVEHTITRPSAGALVAAVQGGTYADPGVAQSQTV